MTELDQKKTSNFVEEIPAWYVDLVQAMLPILDHVELEEGMNQETLFLSAGRIIRCNIILESKASLKSISSQLPSNWVTPEDQIVN